MRTLRTTLAYFLVAITSACANMAPADKADTIFRGAHLFGSTAVAFGPQGRFVVSGGHQGDVKLWDVHKRQLLAEARPHQGPVLAIAINGNSLFATASDDGSIFLWDNGKALLRKTDKPASSLIWFQGRLVSGHGDSRLRIWDKSLRETGTLLMEEDIVGLAVHREHIAVAMQNRIVILDAQFRTNLVLDTDGSSPHDLQFSPDGKTLAAGGWFRLHVWDLATLSHRSIPTEHGGLLTSVSFSPDGRHIATLGRNTDSAIRIMDTRNFKVERRYQAHELCGAMIRFSPDGHWMASASDDESVRFYDMRRDYRPREKYDNSFGEESQSAPFIKQAKSTPADG